MKLAAAIAAGLLLALPLHAGAAAPEEVLQQVQQQQGQVTRSNQEREARFAREKSEAAGKLAKARGGLGALQSRGKSLQAQFDANQKELVALQGQQTVEASDATELPRALRIIAGNFRVLLADSWVNAQYPAREKLLAQMSDEKAVPSTRDLEQLWHALEDQLRESGRSARFTAEVHDGDEAEKETVIRVGEFSAVEENGHFLLYEPQKGLTPAAHQPAWRWRRLASNFADESKGLAPMALDPGAGSVLRQIAQQPNVLGRIIRLLVLFALLMLAGAQLRRLWAPPPRWRRRVVTGAVGEALAVYDSRFNVALFVSLCHLAFLLWLLQGLIPSNATASLATQQQVFEIVPVEGPPAAKVEQAAAPGAPGPPPPIPAPNLAISMPKSMVNAPPVDVAMPSINMPVEIQSGGALFGGQFAGFAGSAGTGQGAGGAGSGTGGGGFGRGVGGGGKPFIPLSTARPQISRYAYERGIEGWVVVSFTVHQGRTRDIRIVDSEPKGIFEAAAVESISHWIYPSEPSGITLTQRVEFKLEDFQYNWNEGLAR
jgi:protein TonB